jgi:hypothetical protein
VIPTVCLPQGIWYPRMRLCTGGSPRCRPSWCTGTRIKAMPCCRRRCRCRGWLRLRLWRTADLRSTVVLALWLAAWSTQPDSTPRAFGYLGRPPSTSATSGTPSLYKSHHHRPLGSALTRARGGRGAGGRFPVGMLDSELLRRFLSLDHRRQQDLGSTMRRTD